MLRIALILMLLCTTGCSLFKEQTGEFVTEAVVDHIAEKVDQRLERRGLSITQIKNVTDLNDDGKVDLDEIKTTAKLAAVELVEAKAAQQYEKWEKATKQFVTIDSQTTVKSKVEDFWMWLKATMGALVMAVITYLTKQVFSAKSDGRRDTQIAKTNARQDMMERLLGKDLNQDGQIGTNGDPVPEAEL
jgi:hypothetical protein